MTCKEFEMWMIDYMDGSLSREQRERVDAHLQKCATCRTMLADEEAVHAELHQLPKMSCPDDVIDQLLDAVGDDTDSLTDRIRSWFRVEPVWKFGLAGALALALIVAAIYIPYEKHMATLQQTEYTPEEIEQAKSDIELALAYFHHYAQKTETIIEQQVLSEAALKPIKSSIGKAISNFPPI
ncbi:zf-HC2 domain-containing protein [candidate division KSB1 bacterium]|nr:zf-HC2 domain-containing protein [candidate division KSB1 bacterium]